MSTNFQPALDQQLTGISNKLVNADYIAERILTFASAKFTVGKIMGYTKEHLRILNTVSGGRTAYPRVEVSTARSDAYQIETHGLSHVITEEDLINSIDPYNERVDVTEDLTSLLWLGKEKALADTMGLTASYAAGNAVTLAGTDQYSDYNSSDPLGDFSTARAAIQALSGKVPNKAVMSWQVYNMLKFHPKILEVGYKYNRSGQLTDQELAQVMEVESLLIGKAVYNSSKPGQADSLGQVWGKNISFLYAPDSGSKKMQTFGFRLQLDGQAPRRVTRDRLVEPVGSELVQVDDKYEQLITDNTCGYLIKNAVA